MSEEKSARPLLRASDRAPEQTFSHPMNPRSELRGVSLSEATGLRRVGLHFIRIPPGREANIFHAHSQEEEFYYVLSGRGVVELEDGDHEIGPGDFLGFPCGASAHLLKNPFDEELVYLVGGERKDAEIARLPKLRKHLIRVGRKAFSVDDEHLQLFWKGDD